MLKRKIGRTFQILAIKPTSAGADSQPLNALYGARNERGGQDCTGTARVFSFGAFFSVSDFAGLTSCLHRLVVACVFLALAEPSTSACAQSRGEGFVSPEPQTSRKCSSVWPGSHETYGLPSTAKPPAGVSFVTDWTATRTGGWFGQQAMDSCRIQPDGFLTWHGKAAVRIEVQPNDDPLALSANSERAEMLLMQDANGVKIRESASSGLQYYATSYFFPEIWHGQQLPWSAFAPTDCSAGDHNVCNSWSIVWQFYGWGALSAAQTSLNGPPQYLFNSSPLGLIKLEKWTDFVFLVDWRSGAYTVWRRDEGESKFSKVLAGQTPVRRDVYVKQGLYRGGNVGGRADIFWIGPTARGSSFSAVEQAAFATDTGRR